MFNPNQDSPLDQNNVQFYAGYAKYLNFLVTNPHGMFVRREWDPRKKMQMDYFYDVECFGNCYTIMLNYTYGCDEYGWFIRMGQNVVAKNGHSRFGIAFDDEKIQRLYTFQSAIYDTDRTKINGAVRKQAYQLALNLAMVQGGTAILEYDPDEPFRMEKVGRAYALITAFTRAPDRLVVHEGNKFIVKIRTNCLQCNWVINKQKNFLEVTMERCGQGSTPYDPALYKIAHMPLSAQDRRELVIFERNMLEASSPPWIQPRAK